MGSVPSAKNKDKNTPDTAQSASKVGSGGALLRRNRFEHEIAPKSMVQKMRINFAVMQAVFKEGAAQAGGGKGSVCLPCNARGAAELSRAGQAVKESGTTICAVKIKTYTENLRRLISKYKTLALCILCNGYILVHKEDFVMEEKTFGYARVSAQRSKTRAARESPCGRPVPRKHKLS